MALLAIRNDVGLDATIELATLPGIAKGDRGVDHCCCSGGGMPPRVEGPAGMSDAEAALLLTAMHFPNLETVEGYVVHLDSQGCDVSVARRTRPRWQACSGSVRRSLEAVTG